MSAECVYQWRYFESNPTRLTAGEWSRWMIATAEEYAKIEKWIDEGKTYQLRVLQVSYVYPHEEVVANYKVFHKE